MSKTSTSGVIGLYGTDSVYYFWLNFIPAQDILSESTFFYLWFQMGDSSSNWDGVQHSNAEGAMTESIDCLPVSATNSVFISSEDSKYDDDSTFNGIVLYDASNPQIQVWRIIEKYE